MKFLEKALLATAILALASGSAQGEQLRHKTELDVQFGSIPVGTATFDIRFDQKSYSLDASGKTVGVAELFASGRGKAESTGRFNGGAVIADRNFVEYVEKKKTSTLEMGFADGAVETVVLVPDKRKTKVAPKYVPILQDQLKAVIDPASSIVVPVPWEEAKDPKAVCNRTIPIYDGDTRFDIALKYKSTKPVETEGYKGYAYVCQLRYVPVAGHRTKQRNIEYMSQNKDMEIWLAPMAQTNIFTPIRIEVPTWIGRVSAQPSFFGTVTN